MTVINRLNDLRQICQIAQYGGGNLLNISALKFWRVIFILFFGFSLLQR